jgi:hypothetical protein
MIPRPGIQNLAPGMMQLLGLKNNGQAPGVLSDVVAPVLNVLPFYLQANVELLAGGSALPASGFTGFFPVPTRETWYIHSASSDLSGLAATEYAEISACVYAASGAGYTAMSRPNNRTTWLATDTLMAGGILRDVWAPGGSYVGIKTWSTNAAAPYGQLYASITRLLI